MTAFKSSAPRTQGNVVAGNKIGTDATGTIALGNSANGIEIDADADNTIGGSTVGAGNVISANGGYGVWLTQEGTNGNVVEGNLIGTDITGTAALGNARSGVQIDLGAASNTIGGSTAAAGNLISNNNGPGVVVGDNANDPAVGNQITANRIFANSGQAIDLGDDGITDNASSPRQGPNNFQNFPIILTTTDGQLEGGLSGSLADTTFRIDLFASAAWGPGGSGEADLYLGSLDVTTDSQGQVGFDVPFTRAGRPADHHGHRHRPPRQHLGGLGPPPGHARGTGWEHSRRSRVRPRSSRRLGRSHRARRAGCRRRSNPVWDLTLSVSAGTLELSSLSGLAGSGNGTGHAPISGASLGTERRA